MRAAFKACSQLSLFPDRQIPDKAALSQQSGIQQHAPSATGGAQDSQVRKSVVSSTRTAWGRMARSTLAVSRLRWLVLAL